MVLSPSSDPGLPASYLDVPIALQKGKCSCTYPISMFVSGASLSSSAYSFGTSLDSVIVPTTISEVLSHKGWHMAMLDEMYALEHNHTWDLV